MADHKVHDLTPEDVSKGMAEGRYLLVDVREPNEVAVEAYPGGVVVPLSTFDPKAIPDPQGKQVVFACRSGLCRERRRHRALAGAAGKHDLLAMRIGNSLGIKVESGTTTASG